MSKIKRVEIMNRASFIRNEDNMILKFDLSQLENMEDVERVVEYFRTIVVQMPRQSIVGLVDFTGLKIADKVASMMISLTEFCTPYFRASAIIANDEGGISLAHDISEHFGKLNMPVYQEDELAKEWLFTQ